MGLYRTIAKIVPTGVRKRLEAIILTSDMRMHPDNVIGFFMLFIAGTSLATAFFLSTFSKWNFGIVLIASIIILFSGSYLVVIVSADKKAKFIEEVLPDALQLMASNLRAGISVERSLLLAARPEFGPLEKEIHRVSKEVTTGKDIGSALLEMSKRIRLKSLERVVQLIITGLKSGGKLSYLLENSSEDLRAQKLIKQKIRSNVEIYIIFIFVATGLGAPILFALSLFLVKVIISNFSNIDIPASASATLPISINQVQISTSFLLKYILISLSSTSILSGFTLGLISKGNAKSGSKYIPMLIGMGMGIFFLISYILTKVFGELFAL